MIITPEEFSKKMKEIQEQKGHDEEMAHAMADDLMLETLISLGYQEGVEIFDNMNKWYG